MTLGALEAARRLGLSLSVRLAIDVSQSALSVFEKNLACEDSKVMNADIASVFTGDVGSNFSGKMIKLAREIGRVDVLMAGPPCQGHSNLNNRSRRNDPRNELYVSVIRAVELLLPKLAIIENVPGVIHDRKGVVMRAHALLMDLGYRVFSSRVNFQDFGVPQARWRHVTIASRVLSVGELRSVCAPTYAARHVVGEFLEGIEDEPFNRRGPFYEAPAASELNSRRMSWLFENDRFDLPDDLRPACHREKNHTYRSMYGRMRWDRPAQTITSGFGSMGQGRFVHPTRRRTLTCHEAARIQGFPDFFRFDGASKTELRQMIGNAVPPQFCASVIEAAFGKVPGSAAQ